MSPRQVLLVAVCLALLLCVLAGPAVAAYSSVDLHLLKPHLDSQQALVSEWFLYAKIELLLVISVGLLGALVTLFQIIKTKWSTHLVAVLGLAIASLTVVTNQFFDVDHKTYRKCAGQADREISKARDYIALVESGATSDENKEELVLAIKQCVQEVDSIISKLESAEFAPASPIGNIINFTLVKEAWAQSSSQPPWVLQKMTEGVRAYRFVGEASDPMVAASRSQALANAQNIAARELGIDVHTVQRYGTVVEQYYAYDANMKSFRCYVLLEMNKAFIPPGR